MDSNSADAVLERLLKLIDTVEQAKGSAMAQTDIPTLSLLTWFGEKLDTVMGGEEQPGRSPGS